jgi:hypothetical protein
VFVLENTNLSQFMTGDPPDSIKQTDLRTNSTIVEVSSKTAEVVSSFVTLTRKGIDDPSSEDSLNIFKSNYLVAYNLLLPMVDLMKREGNIWGSSYDPNVGSQEINMA